LFSCSSVARVYCFWDGSISDILRRIDELESKIDELSAEMSDCCNETQTLLGTILARLGSVGGFVSPVGELGGFMNIMTENLAAITVLAAFALGKMYFMRRRE
jgi:hypothetical protein